jgi:hypothetical protein
VLSFLLRTILRSDSGSSTRTCPFTRWSGSRPSPSAALAHGPAALPQQTRWRCWEGRPGAATPRGSQAAPSPNGCGRAVASKSLPRPDGVDLLSRRCAAHCRTGCETPIARNASIRRAGSTAAEHGGTQSRATTKPGLSAAPRSPQCSPRRIGSYHPACRPNAPAMPPCSVDSFHSPVDYGAKIARFAGLS